MHDETLPDEVFVGCSAPCAVPSSARCITQDIRKMASNRLADWPSSSQEKRRTPGEKACMNIAAAGLEMIIFF